MSLKIVRYLVFAQGENPASYNESLGKQAYYWARDTAVRYGGALVSEYSDGSTKLLGNYRRPQPESLPEVPPESAPESV